MKLKPQPRPPRRSPRSTRTAHPRGLSIGRGRQARRPGVPLRRRLGGRLPPLRRVLAGLAAVASVAGLVALLGGPWLRVSDVAWSGQAYTDAGDLANVLDTQRGASLLAVDTRSLRQRIERLPAVAGATVATSLTGRVEATIVERRPAFVWETASARYVGDASGTLFAGGRDPDALDDASLDGLPHVRDERFLARLVGIGEVIPEPLLRIAMHLAAVDPAALGSSAAGFDIRIDDEYGFRLASEDAGWEIALGVYGLDPTETAAQADARLEHQVAAVRTLFAAHPESELGWVDVRNPGKVYFRAKG